MIRGIFQSLTETAGKVRRFVASGRVREIIRNGGFYQHYGFASDPPASAKIIVEGNSGTEMSVAEDDPSTRPQLKSMNGAAAIYYDAEHYVLIKKDGSIIIKTDNPVIIDATDIMFGGSTLLPISGVVTGECICAFTGAPHIDKSLKVKAAK